MNLSLPKSFQMMKLLNRDHGPFVRGLGACGLYAVTFLATQRHGLSQDVARQFWTHNDSKSAARRTAWYLRRSWLKLSVMEDDYFDPTEGMSDTTLTQVDGFLVSRETKMDAISFHADRAFIAARTLDNNTHDDQRQQNAAAFKDRCDTLLLQAKTAPPLKQKTQKARKGDFPIEDAKQTLADFQALFPQNQLPWFVVSGTFLGLIRENGFLAHDYDIDLGIFEDQINITDTCAALASSDRFVLKKYDHHKSSLFTPTTVSGNPDIPYILKIVHVSGIHIDLFIHYRDTSVDPVVYWHGSSLHRWENSAFALVSYQFYDQNVLGPKDADTYLTENYGNWRTPVTDFNCTTDTPNLALVSHPIAIVIFLKRYVTGMHIDGSASKKLREELVHNGFLQIGPDKTLSLSGDLFVT